MSRTYPDPWVPRSFGVFTRKRSSFERTASGERRAVDRWEAAGRADGSQWRKTFHRAGHAQAWVERLKADYASGLPFDLKTKQFVRPVAPTETRAPTVFELTEAYFRQHPEWEPRTKVAAASSLNRARRWLLVPEVSPSPSQLDALEDFLDHASFLPAHLADQMTNQRRFGHGSRSTRRRRTR